MPIKNVLSVLFLALLLIVCVSGNASEAFTVAQVRFEQLEIPDNEALDFTQTLNIGWNLGNTFDAVNCYWLTNKLDYESAWVGVKTTPRLFETLKEAGFTSVRIPVSWHNHVSGENDTIDSDWLARIKEVVGYALDQGLYVILNTHHDIGKEYIYPDEEHLESSMFYLTNLWKQIAEEFRDVNDHLLFESMNEPRLVGTNIEWWLDPLDPMSTEAVQCINQLNQAFVDTVRLTGGENATRYLLVPGYNASVEGVLHSRFELPMDMMDNRLIVSVHAYTPYAFALQDLSASSSTNTFDPASQKDCQGINSLMKNLYSNFIRRGIPVVLGEFGARDKNNLQARADYTAYYVAIASAHGIPCFYWDNNAFTGNGVLLGLLDRKTNTFVYPEILDSMMVYALKQSAE